MIKRLLLFTLVFGMFAGCQKTQDYFEFDLTIVDQNGNKVESATVEGYARPAGSGGIGSYELRETAITDASGKVNIRIDKETVFGFRFDITAENHFATNHIILADEVPVTSAYEADLSIQSQSWFKINIENTSGAIAVFWNYDTEAPDCNTCCKEANSTYLLQGSNVDTSFLCTLYGDQSFTLDGSYTDDQIVVHPFSHDLFAPAGDTLVYDLIY